MPGSNKKKDYRKLGLKCGIEIHQQLDTHKLFCACPSEIRDEEPDFCVQRKLRAVAGELGNVDPAAIYELLKDQNFIYEGYNDTTCLVELDEEPPHMLNKDALNIVIESSLLLNARIVDELQIMRKTVIDGSNTSGFQRTILVAMDGYVEVKTQDGKKKVRIPTICLEEDAARIIKQEGNTRTYRLDRLGIPLIEIGTDPDITTPEEAKATAERLGMILRSTGRVKRGLGTIRQDVNVSIVEGERIEIKGVQTLKDIPSLVRNEVSRQEGLIEIREELKKRGFKEFRPEIKELTKTIKATESKLLKGKELYGIAVPKFIGLIGKELMPKYRFGTELAGIAKGVAGLKGVLHSDELPAYGLTQQEVTEIRKILCDGEEDAFVLVVAEKDLAHKALEAIADRCNICLKGVPQEVRRADGEITRFMRPLPGSARMYPETDEPVTPINQKDIASIENTKSLLPEEELKLLREMGLGAELANQLVHSHELAEFKELAQKFKELRISLIADTFLSRPKDVTIPQIEELLTFVDSKKLAKESIEDVLKELAKSGSDVAKTINTLGLSLMSDAETKKAIEEILKDNKDLVDAKNFGALMGRSMSELRGKANAESVQRILKELL
jgi:glutamyl-tRNA(Gln) amidotransferase subunit E